MTYFPPPTTANSEQLYPQLQAPGQTQPEGWLQTSTNIPNRGFAPPLQQTPTQFNTTNVASPLFHQNVPSQLFSPQETQQFAQLERQMNSPEVRQQFAHIEQQIENIINNRSREQQAQLPQIRGEQPLSEEELNVSCGPLSNREQSQSRRIFALLADETFTSSMEEYCEAHPQFKEKLEQRFALYENVSCGQQDARRFINYFQNRGLNEILPLYTTTFWPVERKQRLFEALTVAFEVIPLPTGESCFCRCWRWIKDYILDPIYRFFRTIFCCKPLSGIESESDGNSRINAENAQRINQQMMDDQNHQVHEQMNQILDPRQATQIANQMHMQTVRLAEMEVQLLSLGASQAEIEQIRERARQNVESELNQANS